MSEVGGTKVPVGVGLFITLLGDMIVQRRFLLSQWLPWCSFILQGLVTVRIYRDGLRKRP